MVDDEVSLRTPAAPRAPLEPEVLPPTEQMDRHPRTTFSLDPEPEEHWALPTPGTRPPQTAKRPATDQRYQYPREREGHWETNASGARARELPRRRLDHSPISQAASIRTTEDHLESLYHRQSMLMGVLQAPRVDLPEFNGDPMAYFPFIRAFEENVEKLLPDNGSRLARLTQLCTGAAARAIQCCALLPPSQGYPKARQLLKERFGDHFTITELWVEKLVEGSSRTNLREFADDLRNCYESLNALGASGELQSQSSLVALVKKLPSFLQNKWRDTVFELKEREGRRPGLKDIVKFVEKAAAVASDPVYGAINSRPNKPDKIPQRSSYATSADINCPVCQGSGHTVPDCHLFAGQNPEGRMQMAIKNQLCFVCLQTGHITRDCTNKSKCRARGCGRMHATALHEANWEELRESSRKKREAKEQEQVTGGIGHHVTGKSSFHIRGSKVALPLLPVRVTSPETGTTVETYALLDSGSNISLCQDWLLKSLGAAGRPEQMKLTTLEKANSQTAARVISLTVTDLSGNNLIRLPQVYSRPNLNLSSDNLVTEDEVNQWPHLKDLPLHYADTKEVTLLIGQDCPDALVPLTTVPGARGEPYAIRTRLGWTVSGPVCGHKKSTPSSYFTLHESLGRLHEKVDRFWRLESGGIFEQEREMSTRDKTVLSQWKEAAVYGDGHYTLPIPFRDTQPKLPNNQKMAEKRLSSLARKLQKNPALQTQYAAGMQDLIAKGYAVRVPEKELSRSDGRVWYLPHHPVINPNKDKPRIVFDCAAEHHGTSLNNKVLPGPDLTNRLVGVLNRFRLHPVAIMADIEAMFHQVRVEQHDQDALRFLWWPGGDLEQNPASYRMTVHLFGGTWSPSCCTYALHRTAEDHAHAYSPAARDTVLRNFYVDDCLKSVPTVEEAVSLVKQLKGLVAQGGFNLTKWTSNSPTVLQEIPPEDQSKKVKERTLDAPLEDRALGVYWNVQDDQLGFQVQEMAKPLTKRGILSMLSSVYDPLGIASPFVLKARKIMQDLCRIKIGWDEQVPLEQRQQWLQWTEGLKEMVDIRVPRCIQPPNAFERQLHHFTDASETAYGVVTYLRTLDTSGQTTATLVMAKSRLAPIKQLTIPRLELQAATLATRQDSLLRRELDLDLARSQYWTDSTIVLRYIANTEARYHTFVANRVAEIQEATKFEDWHHVPTLDNPADDASRGVPASALARSRWLHGPSFLSLPPERWPVLKRLQPLNDEDPEVKKAPASSFATQRTAGDDPIKKLIASYSNWTRLLRVLACFTLIPDVRLRGTPPTKILQTEHLQRAEERLVGHIQDQYYRDEISSIKRGQKIPPSSPLARLRPALRRGLLVVPGRLDNANLPAETKTPTILPQQHPAIEILVRHTHERTAHSGKEYVLAELRRRYWIIGASTLVRRVLARCVHCRRRDARPCAQQQAVLPPDRVTPEEPAFSSIGVDYFGPIPVKRGRGREKKYGCLFTCLTTRAVHVEVADSLDTDSFLNCFYRFMARRGEPKLVRSDNGKNFVGAERELRQELEQWNHGRIQDEMNDRRIKWLFNPPAASHMGGVWERQIRSVKRVLAGLTHEQVLSYEMLVTLLVVAEGIINNRPITPVSDDPRDPEPLTPNHLLIHRPATAPPGLFNDRDLHSRKKWRQVQYLADVFWRRWTREYLPLLRQRTKWQDPHRNVQEGDLVLVLERQLARNEWPVGRVTDVRTGADGLVRSARIRVKDSELVRPITKLCVLEEVACNLQ